MSASACPNDVKNGLWTYMDDDKKSDLTMTILCKGICFIYICNIILYIHSMPKESDILRIFLGEKKDVLPIVPTTPRSNNVKKQGKHISRVRISCSIS